MAIALPSSHQYACLFAWESALGTATLALAPIATRERPMSDATPSRPSADRHLLFGILALQMDFITRDALIAAMNAWVLDKAKPLGQIMIEQGAIRADNRDLLDVLVSRH